MCGNPQKGAPPGGGGALRPRVYCLGIRGQAFELRAREKTFRSRCEWIGGGVKVGPEERSDRLMATIRERFVSSSTPLRVMSE